MLIHHSCSLVSQVDLNSVENMLSRLSNKFETSIKNVNKKIDKLTRVTMNVRSLNSFLQILSLALNGLVVATY